MKQIIALAFLLLCFALTTAGQRRKSSRRPTQTVAPVHKTTPAPPPIVGAAVSIATRNGEQITGQVLEVSPYRVRVKQGQLESTVPFESIASIRFGDAPLPPVVTAAPQPNSQSPDFIADATSLMNLFQGMDSATQAGTEYGDYGRRLGELRRATERFISKFAGSDNQTETKIALLFSAAVDDYSRARTIWTLRLGQGATATVAATDSPAVADAVELYPDLAQLGPRNKLPADKLVAGLWKQASLKIVRSRRMLEQAR